jgi:hypothetical protein
MEGKVNMKVGIDYGKTAKLSRTFLFYLLTFLLFPACVSTQKTETIDAEITKTASPETATIEISGSPGVGDNWKCTAITPEGIVRFVSVTSPSPPSRPGEVRPVGGYQAYIYEFEAITPGQAQIIFSNFFRGASEPSETKTYRAIVDDMKNLTLQEVRFPPWYKPEVKPPAPSAEAEGRGSPPE